MWCVTQVALQFSLQHSPEELLLQLSASCSSAAAATGAVPDVPVLQVSAAEPCPVWGGWQRLQAGQRFAHGENCEWIFKVLGVNLHVLCVQCSKKSAEIFFSFITIAFVYSLSIAFSRVVWKWWWATAECDSNVCGSFYLSLPSHTCCLGTEPPCTVFLIAAVIRTQRQRGCPSGVPCLLLVLSDLLGKSSKRKKTPRFWNTVKENHISCGD